MPETGSERVLLNLVREVRQGLVVGKQLSDDDRRACVEFFWAEGVTAHETAMIMGISDRTIFRDRKVIKKSHALSPDQDLSNQIVGELYRRAEIAIEKLNKAVRDQPGEKKVNPHMRIRAAIHSYRIYDRLTYRLWKLKYLHSPVRNDPHSDALVDALIQGMNGGIKRG